MYKYILGLTLIVLFLTTGCGSSSYDDEDSSSSNKGSSQNYNLHKTYTGTGKNYTNSFYLKGNRRVVFTYSYTGEGNFVVWLSNYQTGEHVDLVANEIGNCSGRSSYAVTYSGKYYFDIELADGSWEIAVDQN